MLSLSKLFSSLLVLLNVAALSAALAFAAWKMRSLPEPPPNPPVSVVPAIFHSAPSIDCVQKLADLVSLRVQVSDILTVDQPGWLSGYKGAWIIHGDALCVTDLNRARIQELSGPTGDQVVQIELPLPEVRGARLDHNRTRTFDLRSKSWLPLFAVPESVREESLQRAQQIVERTANQEDHLIQAQRQTEAVLTTFYAAAGFRTEIVWNDPAADSATDSPLDSPDTVAP